jgi:hypothetical protein
VRRGRGVVERRDPEPAVRVDARRIGDDLGEAVKHAVVRQDGLDEEGVGVAHHLQVTPTNGSSSMPLPASKNIGRSVGNRHGVVPCVPQRRRRLDCGNDVRVERRAPEAVADVLGRLPPGVELRHHPVLERETEIDLARVFPLEGRGEVAVP